MNSIKLIALSAALALTGCAGITFKSVISDVSGWATAANVLWQDSKQSKSAADVTKDLIAGGVSPATADEVVAWLPVINGVVSITPNLVASVDALVKAALTK